MRRVLIKVRIEFWWFCEKLADRIWTRFCPEDKASYWLDWLTPIPYKRRKNAEWDMWRLTEKQP